MTLNNINNYQLNCVNVGANIRQLKKDCLNEIDIRIPHSNYWLLNSVVLFKEFCDEVLKQLIGSNEDEKLTTINRNVSSREHANSRPQSDSPSSKIRRQPQFFTFEIPQPLASQTSSRASIQPTDDGSRVSLEESCRGYDP